MSTYDVCVIGSGPAGLVMTLELAKMGNTVLLVESGNEQSKVEIQSLSEAKISNPISHSVMKEAVWRGMGGTSMLWGGRCVPFDPIDFEKRDYVVGSGWPISETDLIEFYQLASDYLGINNPYFNVKNCLEINANHKDLASNFNSNQSLETTNLERWSSTPKLWSKFKHQLLSNEKVTILNQNTCVGFVQHKLGENVTYAKLKPTLNRGAPFRMIEARIFVIACGGVESTRLILNSMADLTGLKLLGANNVGLYYMGHLSGKIADIQFNGNPQETIYGFERDNDIYVRRRITFSKQILRNEELLNIAFWLDNPPIFDWRHASGVLSAAYLGLTLPILRNFLAPPAIRKRVAGEKLENLSKHLMNCLKSPLSTLSYVFKFIWFRYFSKPPIPGFFTYSSNNRYALHFHSEQLPSIDSKITLTDETDSTGLKRAKINLRWSKQDVDSVVKAHHVLDTQLKESGVGELHYRYTEDTLVQGVIDQSIDGFHQLGTLRMANEASSGVTNSFGQLFGVANTYVASSAIFPTSGQANPTFLMVANTIRQAKHITEILKA